MLHYMIIFMHGYHSLIPWFFPSSHRAGRASGMAAQARSPTRSWDTGTAPRPRTMTSTAPRLKDGSYRHHT